MQKIAVITPCFNSSKFIFECIKSVAFSQTFGMCEVEHIIIDDGSTDDTWERIQRAGGRGVRSLRLEENHGPAYARNFGIQDCDADFIFCLDADDVIFQNTLFSLSRCAQEKKANWVYGDFLRSNAQLQYQLGNDYFGWNFTTTEEVLAALFKNQHFFQHNCFFSKNAFAKVGGYDNSLHMAEDFDLYTRMLLDGCLPQYLPGALYIHRFHDHNLSQEYTQHPEKNLEVIRQQYAKYAVKLKEKLSPSMITEIEALIQPSKSSQR